MSDTYNLYNLEASFRNYLLAGIKNERKSLTLISVRNYLSDFRHFIGWLTFYLKSHDVRVEEFINENAINEYKSYLLNNNLPHKTINRRLSTVRKFCSFCITQGWLKENPAKKVTNVISDQVGDDVLHQFQRHLHGQNLDQSTINSYLNTIQELLNTI